MRHRRQRQKRARTHAARVAAERDRESRRAHRRRTAQFRRWVHDLSPAWLQTPTVPNVAEDIDRARDEVIARTGRYDHDEIERAMERARRYLGSVDKPC